MSAKKSIFYDRESQTHVYQEVTTGGGSSPVYVEVNAPEECSITKQQSGEVTAVITLSEETMDKIVKAWCE